MSVQHSDGENGTDSTTIQPQESDPDYVARDWIQDGVDEDVDDGETRYYAVLQTITQETNGDQMRPDVEGWGEDITIHVLYVRGDASRAVEREYVGRAVDEGDQTVVDPKILHEPGFSEGWPASIAVDGDHVVPRSIERSEEIVRALAELHDIGVDEEGNA